MKVKKEHASPGGYRIGRISYGRTLIDVVLNAKHKYGIGTSLFKEWEFGDVYLKFKKKPIISNIILLSFLMPIVSVVWMLLKLIIILLYPLFWLTIRPLYNAIFQDGFEGTTFIILFWQIVAIVFMFLTFIK